MNLTNFFDLAGQFSVLICRMSSFILIFSLSLIFCDPLPSFIPQLGNHNNIHKHINNQSVHDEGESDDYVQKL
jgi:hypothetical protein